MAKKFVRGITDVKTINNQDFDTNNVNDLLSDGQYNYIHRKKGKNEEYHNLTDNIKTLSSDNTDLLTVTNNNKTTNTATLHPKHDKQKEQVLESTRDTITIHHGTNGTAEKTTVDTNPQKVLEHEKLKTGDGLTTSFNSDETTITFKATKKTPETNLNTLGEGVIRGKGFSIDQVPDGNQGHSAAYVTINTSDNRKVQFYIRESGVDHSKIKLYYRFIINGEVTEWKQMVGDSGELNNLLAQKQDVLTAGDGITIEGQTVDTNPQKVLEHDNLIAGSYLTKTSSGNTTTLKLSDDFVGIVNAKQNTLTSNTSIGVLPNNSLRQLFYYMKTYNGENGLLRTYIKDMAQAGSETTYEEEYYFTLKINKGSQNATFTLNEQDKTRFNNIITTYGESNAVRINGALFELSDSTLSVTTDANTSNNYVITFSDII